MSAGCDEILGMIGRRSKLTAIVSTWLVLCSTAAFTGGLALPCVVVLSSFAVRCTLMVKNRWPFVVSHAATRGFRLAFHAALVGSIRPGLNLPDKDFPISLVLLSGRGIVHTHASPSCSGTYVKRKA